MTDPKPNAAPYIETDDLLYLAADLGPGYFSAGQLYEWHVSQLSEVDRLPVSKKRFGMTLKEHGWQNSVRQVEGRQVRCWLINKPWARRGDQYLKDRVAAYNAAQAEQAKS